MQNPARETQTLLHPGAFEGQWDFVGVRSTERRGGVICTNHCCFPGVCKLGARASCPEIVGTGTRCISVRLYLPICWPLSSPCARQGSWGTAENSTNSFPSSPLISALICCRRAEGRSWTTGSRLTRGLSTTPTPVPATRSRWKLTSCLLTPRSQVPCPLSADLADPCLRQHAGVRAASVSCCYSL